MDESCRKYCKNCYSSFFLIHRDDQNRKNKKIELLHINQNSLLSVMIKIDHTRKMWYPIKENTARFSKGEILWRGGTNEVERKKEEEENKSDGKERLFGRGNDSRARASGQEKTAKERSP